jgi:hypothetical protein
VSGTVDFKGEPFSVADLEPYVTKMESFDNEHRAEGEKLEVFTIILDSTVRAYKRLN